jgi:tripartite-type tricarboxylate transporter receptor subunit TctC
MRLAAGEMMGLGDVSASVIPKPVLVSAGDTSDSITSRYFTPRRCHASHAVTGAIGVASAFALPGTVASGTGVGHVAARRNLVVLHPAGRIDIEVEMEGHGDSAQIRRASLVRTARKIMQGELHIPDYVLSRPDDVAGSGQAPAALAGTSTASAFPDKTLTIVVPTSAGGGNDAMARTIGKKLGERLGQAVIIDNRAGANGSIASEYVAGATPDGHTLMLGYIATHAMNPALQKVRYDPVADFEPIGLVGYSPTLMVAGSDVPVRDVKDMIKQLRAHPEKYNYVSAGTGTAPHFAGELFKLSSGTSMAHVPCNGAAPALTEMISGHAHFMFPSLFTAAPQVKTGKLRALAVAGPKRSAALPDVPTLAEAGVEDVDVTQWYGLFAPARTPASVIGILSQALREVLSDPQIITRMEQDGAEVQAGTPEQLRSLVQSELAKWTRVVRKAKLVEPS